MRTKNTELPSMIVLNMSFIADRSCKNNSWAMSTRKGNAFSMILQLIVDAINTLKSLKSNSLGCLLLYFTTFPSFLLNNIAFSDLQYILIWNSSMLYHYVLDEIFHWHFLIRFTQARIDFFLMIPRKFRRKIYIPPYLFYTTLDYNMRAILTNLRTMSGPKMILITTKFNFYLALATGERESSMI